MALVLPDYANEVSMIKEMEVKIQNLTKVLEKVETSIVNSSLNQNRNDEDSETKNLLLEILQNQKVQNLKLEKLTKKVDELREEIHTVETKISDLERKITIQDSRDLNTELRKWALNSSKHLNPVPFMSIKSTNPIGGI